VCELFVFAALNVAYLTDMVVYLIIVDYETGNLLKIEDTKLFAEFRTEISDGESKSYDNCEELMRFIDEYAVHNIGTRELYKYTKAKPGDTLLDYLTVQDIAYTLLVYENSVDVWNEIMQHRGQKNPRTATQLYHAKRGTKLKEFSDGWTEVGKQYYGSLVKMVKGWRSNEMFWETLQGHWREYAKKNHSSISVRTGPAMEDADDIEEDEEEIEMMDFTQV